MPYVKIGSTKALNRWDLGSQHLIPIIASSLRCPSRLSYLQLFAFYLMAQSNHGNRNQSQGIYIYGLSQFGPHLGKMPIGLISFCCGQRS